MSTCESSSMEVMEMGCGGGVGGHEQQSSVRRIARLQKILVLQFN